MVRVLTFSKKLPLLFSLFAATGPCLLAASYVHTEVGGQGETQRWSIGNDYVERTIAYSPREGLRTEALLYKVTGRDFTAYSRSMHAYGGEFGLQVDKQNVASSSLAFSGVESKEFRGGRSLELRLTNAAKSLEISVFYAVYDDSPALRKWISVVNRGQQPITLSNFSFELLAAAPGTPAELTINGGYGVVPRELFFTGRVSDPAVFVRNAHTGEGFAIVNEAPGYLKRTEAGEGWSERFRVMYDTDLFPFKRVLAPEETFESAKCSLVFFFEGHGYSDSHWAVPGFVTHHIARRAGSLTPPWIYNTWEPFERKIDEKTLAELAPAAQAAGLQLFTIDDGWQAVYGSNGINLKNFPGGMKKIASLLQENHLKLGLWVPLAAISTNTSEYRSHPDWACRDSAGKPKFTGTMAGQSAVMCLGSSYREAALKRLENLIDLYHPAYLKVDLTSVFNAYGEAPGCFAKGHFHGDWAESLTRIYEGLQYIGKTLYRVHPEVLIDYTFEVWGEKHLIDPALLECADLDWMSNVADPRPEAGGPLHARMLLYQRSISIPVETMLIGNLHSSTPPIEERFATELGSAPLLLGDLRKLSPAEARWYKQKITWYNQVRARASLDDSFFPLGNWQQPNESSWDGFARISHHADALVVLFRNASSDNSVTVRIAAPAQAHYTARSQISGAALGEVGWNTLQNGWRVSFPAGHTVEIIDLERIKSKETPSE